MNESYQKLQSAVAQLTQPVILLEGTRKVPEKDQLKLFNLGRFLATEFPQAVFRSGNAEGSDTFFARGVESIDPARMQIVTPGKNHRKANLHPLNYVVPLSAISTVNEDELAYATNSATPANQRIIDKRHDVPQLKAKANYLLRDTLKVLGDPDHGLASATAALFFTASDPMSGGTGHTIRVCRLQNVPVFLQNDWWNWVSA